ncbi:MAG: hypothetical protein CM15mP59_0670 [Flavobacteriaceae bacterium]|nr:MAG: hypothetical protein CM15mP59_0670 [Flavobacteriaceae bacterium]
MALLNRTLKAGGMGRYANYGAVVGSGLGVCITKNMILKIPIKSPTPFNTDNGLVGSVIYPLLQQVPLNMFSNVRPQPD